VNYLFDEFDEINLEKLLFYNYSITVFKSNVFFFDEINHILKRNKKLHKFPFIHFYNFDLFFCIEKIKFII
jgi:hypothetical protein